MRKSIILGALLIACSGTTHDASPADDGPPAPPPANDLPCDLDALLTNHCRMCHASPPQYGAPMPLTSYAALTAPAHSDPSHKVYELMLARTANDADPMPPSPNPRLTADERDILVKWVNAGAKAEPSASCAPPDAGPPVPLVSCTPDITVKPTAKWTMPQATKDEYVCYGFDITPDKPTHVVGFAPHVDNTKIVHHLLMFEAPDAVSGVPAPCSLGGSVTWRIVTGWAPGGKGVETPPNVGFPLAAPGSTTHYVMQIHYSNLNGLDGETDESGYGLCTSAPRAQEADVAAFGTKKFTIPATNQPYTRNCTLTVPAELSGRTLFGALPHMHKLGTAITTTLERPGQQAVDLGTQNSFSFQNQTWFAVNAQTQTGDVIRTKCTWTNDTGSPVTYGERTSDEMCYSFTMYYPRITTTGWSWALPAAVSTCQ